MFTTFKTSILALACTLLFTACQKEYNQSNLFPAGNHHGGISTGTAVFKLTGAPQICTNYMVNGTYTAGNVVDATHTVVVEVNVITPGTFAITTGSTNGLTFAASGTFEAPGVQALSLTGVGTPATTGTFNYWPGNVGCSFPVAVTAPQVAVGILDCSQAWSEGTFTNQVAMTDTNKLLIPINVTTAGTYFIQTDSINGTTFSGSGILDAGDQIVVISGNGTPQVAGSYQLTVTLGASTCSFWVTFQ